MSTAPSASSFVIPETAMAQLMENGERSRSGKDSDFYPVVKLFTPDAAATWLLTEVDPDDADLTFGLCDLGLGSPELGYVRLSEIASVRGPLRLPVEIDRHFYAYGPISAYADAARRLGRITCDSAAIAQALTASS